MIHAEETFMFLQPVNVRSTATSGIAVMSNYVKPCETWIENETARKLDGTQEGRRPHQGVVQTECGGFLAAAWQLLHRMKIAAMIHSRIWMILAVSSMTPVTPGLVDSAHPGMQLAELECRMAQSKTGRRNLRRSTGSILQYARGSMIL